MLRLFVVVSLVACTSRHPDCERTISGATDRAVTAGDIVGLHPDIAERTRATMTEACEAEAWTDPALECFATARLATELRACTEKLTHEQYDRLQRKLAGALDTTHPPEPPLWVGPMPMDAGTALPGGPPSPPPGGPLPPPPASSSASTSSSSLGGGSVAVGAENTCATRIVNPRNKTCIAMFCKANPDDLRCQLE